jgi:hypothetical protein
MTTPGQKPAQRRERPNRPRPAVRAALSALILLHLLAVFAGPWALPPQRSQLAATCARLLHPYLQALSLDNGYRFFAPEPGPSHLVRYEVVLPGGEKINRTFPNRQEQWPRLLYHRYFMLSEFINSLGSRGGPQPSAADRRLLEAYTDSYARHLAHVYGTEHIDLYLRRHRIARIDDVRAGMQLSDPALYEEKPLLTYEEDKP